MKTKIVCPVCGCEIAIPENGFDIARSHVIGKNDNLGTIVLPKAESKKSQMIDKLKELGLDTSKMLSIDNDKFNEAVNTLCGYIDDDCSKSIKESGYVPSKSAWPRFMLAQFFHAEKEGSIENWLRDRGENYKWKILEKYYKKMILMKKHKDYDELRIYEHWFTRNVILSMINKYITELKKAKKYTTRKGHVYYMFHGRKYEEDRFSKITSKFSDLKFRCKLSKTHEDMLDVINIANQWRPRFKRSEKFYQHGFTDAFKGLGAWYCCLNLIRFHGCFIKDFYNDCEEELYGDDAMNYLEKLMFVENVPGYIMTGALRSIIKDNGIDIDKKLLEWKE